MKIIRKKQSFISKKILFLTENKYLCHHTSPSKGNLMDIEELRTYCLSLSEETEEKFPFQQFKAAKDILAFYICGHIFCYFNINDLTHVTVKCLPEKVVELIEEYDFIDHPYNGNAKYWVGLTHSVQTNNYLKS